jgi:transaldolase
VPATNAGIQVVEELTARGISVNVTLIFSTSRYQSVMKAYLRGLERAHAAGLELASIHSVASFFISRIDSEIDKRLDSLNPDSPLRGKAAIANAALAYEAFLEFTRGAAWQHIASRGANIQRPLWASTGVKDPAYDPTRYVMDLIAPDCVNTMPEATLNAVRTSGVMPTTDLTHTFSEAKAIFTDLEAAGIDFPAVVAHLESDGVTKFVDAWASLLKNVSEVM